MRFYFLDKTDFIFLTGLTLLILFFVPFLGFILSVALTMLLFFLRVKSTNIESKEVSHCYSPVNGKIIKITQNDHSTKLVLKMRLFGDWGIYSPFKSKVSSLGVSEKPNEKSFFKMNYSKSNLIQVESKSRKVMLDFQEREFSFQEIFLNIDVGDKTQLGSVLGYRLFGGKLVLDLPREFRLNVKKGSRVYASKSILGEYL